MHTFQRVFVALTEQYKMAIVINLCTYNPLSQVVLMVRIDGREIVVGMDGVYGLKLTGMEVDTFMFKKRRFFSVVKCKKQFS